MSNTSEFIRNLHDMVNAEQTPLSPGDLETVVRVLNKVTKDRWKRDSGRPYKDELCPEQAHEMWLAKTDYICQDLFRYFNDWYPKLTPTIPRLIDVKVDGLIIHGRKVEGDITKDILLEGPRGELNPTELTLMFMRTGSQEAALRHLGFCLQSATQDTQEGVSLGKLNDHIDDFLNEYDLTTCSKADELIRKLKAVQKTLSSLGT
jgi:hypothetical protein